MTTPPDDPASPPVPDDPGDAPVPDETGDDGDGDAPDPYQPL